MTSRSMRWLLAVPGLAGLVWSYALAQAQTPLEARPRKVAVIVYDGAALIDFAGPYDVFSHAGQMRRIAGRPSFEVFTVAPGPGPLRSGPRILPDFTLADKIAADIIVIPGGPNEPLMNDPEAMSRLATLARGAEIRMSVCNGAFVLGALGYLNGIAATSNAGTTSALRRRFPQARVVEGVRFVDAGAVVTTSDGATGIDGALHVVERLLGRDAAQQAAAHMAYPWRPQGDGEPVSRPEPEAHHVMEEMSEARRLYLGAVEEIADEGNRSGAMQWLRRSLERGYEHPSDALREPAFASFRKDPTQRAELRALLAAHARESEVEMVAADEPGERLLLELEVVDKESGEPLASKRIYVYQTDYRGDYAPEAEQPGAVEENPRLYAYVRTDARGRAALRSVLPGPYRGTRGARHLHVQIDREGASVYGTAIYFDTDPRPDDELRADAARGRVIVVPMETDQGARRVRAKIRVPPA